MSTAETLQSCTPNERMRIEVVDGRDVIETIEVTAREYTPRKSEGGIDEGLLIVQIDAITDLPEHMSHKLDSPQEWEGTLEISARQTDDGTWTRPVLQAWGTETEAYVELGYVNLIEEL
ncbi:hypothetical protein ACFPYI_15135 [Halomarina salina]|uniref:Uncharacterized protein n=1 Tax=Halomarina salina TaxID=1872699 RepID=A0ABD5RQV2_9EURY|nr:hypothetical protein [Halomarina salina]